MNSIEICNLEKKYHNNLILNIKDLVLDSSNIYFLTQSNGCGKTTLLKCLFNEISYEGLIKDTNKRYVYAPEKVSFPQFISSISFIKNFLFADKDSSLDSLINKYFEYFSIDQYKDTYIDKLSKGTKQKIVLIKTLLSDADVYLFDEPLSGLDVNSRCNFMNLIKELNKMDKIIIIATHYYEEYPYENKKVINLS